LTLGVSSILVAAKLLVMTASNVPIAVSGDWQDPPFAAMVRGAKAELQIASSFSLTWLARVKRVLLSLNWLL
jgi:hypothetical protein